MGILSVGNGILNVENGGVLSVGTEIITWEDWDGSNDTAFTTISIGDPAFPLSLVTLDTDTFVLGFYDNDADPKAVRIDRAGDVLTTGTIRVIDTSVGANANRYQLQRLDTNKLAAFYAGDGGDLDVQNARVITGSSLTLGSEINLGNADRDETLQMVPLDTDKILYIRSRGIASFNVFSQVRTNTGPSTFSAGNFLTVVSGTRGFYKHAVQLPTTSKVVVAQQLQSTQAFQLRVIENTVGNTTVQGSTLTITDDPGVTDQINNLIPIDDSHVALIYSGSDSGGRTYIRIYSVSGTTLTQELGETQILSEQLDNASGSVSSSTSSDFLQVASNEFMFVSGVTGSTESKAYIIRFPTPTTWEIPSTVTIDPSDSFTDLMIQSVDSRTVLVVGRNNTSVVRAKLLKL